MRLATFVNDCVGRSIDADGAFGAQCVDLIQAWSGWLGDAPTFVGGTAASMLPTRPGWWTWIENEPENHPDPGDVVVWHQNLAAAIGAAGHCAIALVADSQALVTLDQNWRSRPTVQLVCHAYRGVAGWWQAKK